MNEVIAGLIGFLIGAAAVAYGAFKSFDDIWDAGYEAGQQYGMETEQIRQALERKEDELFGRDVSGDG